MSYAFNTTSGQTIDRHLLILYLNTGTSQSPAWSPIGKRVEDSSSEYDWQAEKKKDILGATYGIMKKPIITQTFDPCELDAGDAALVKLWELAVRDQDAAALANMDCLVAHMYVGDSTTATNLWAERYPSSMIEVSGLGGEGGGNIGMPITVTLGGTRSVGHVTKDGTSGAITFTAD